MCKVEYQPVINPSDFLIIGNIPALKAECEAIRYGELDSAFGQAMQIKKHDEAIRLLQNEQRHYFGAIKPAVNVSPFGSARLGNQCIGSLI